MLFDRLEDLHKRMIATSKDLTAAGRTPQAVLEADLVCILQTPVIRKVVIARADFHWVTKRVAEHCQGAYRQGARCQRSPDRHEDYYIHLDAVHEPFGPVIIYPEDARKDRIAKKDVATGRAFFSPTLFIYGLSLHDIDADSTFLVECTVFSFDALAIVLYIVERCVIYHEDTSTIEGLTGNA
ncbi:hypothetical protein BV20DRAFT_606110 [Pilatotrama ljubarskyi]|nr:hypothetical protein BV20DRAFT_606110 [Pilatotrama ljubarskyi]